MRYLGFLLTTFIVLSAAGCSTSPTSLDYKSAQTTPRLDAKPHVGVGQFSDQRGTDAHWLGAIRNGFGSPMKTLELPEGISQALRKAFAQGLMTRGVLDEGRTPRFTLTATIYKFDCSQYVRREAHAEIVLRLVENATGKSALEKTVRRDDVEDSSLFDVGIFASPEDLRKVSMETLRRVIDELLDDRDFKQALSS